MNILVLGGAGFIGRHVVRSLLREGHTVGIGTRSPQHALRRFSDAARCRLLPLRLECMCTPEAWTSALEGFEAVVNCVGILRPRAIETYERIHVRAPLALADACAAAGMRRLIHISALGLHAAARSWFIRSKLAADAALLAHPMDICVVRPSLLDSDPLDCGFGSRWLRRVACWPVHFVPADATGRMAPLHAGDLGDAVAALLALPAGRAPRLAELGGADTRTMQEHLAALRRALRPAAAAAVPVTVPAWLARIASHVCDLLHLTPFSFGHLELMRRDNVPRENLLVPLIRRAPRWIGMRAAHRPATIGADATDIATPNNAL